MESNPLRDSFFAGAKILIISVAVTPIYLNFRIISDILGYLLQLTHDIAVEPFFFRLLFFQFYFNFSFRKENRKRRCGIAGGEGLGEGGVRGG